jgi:hypothetical protein
MGVKCTICDRIQNTQERARAPHAVVIHPDPATEEIVIIAPIRHVQGYQELNDDEKFDIDKLIALHRVEGGNPESHINGSMMYLGKTTAPEAGKHFIIVIGSDPEVLMQAK